MSQRNVAIGLVVMLIATILVACAAPAAPEAAPPAAPAAADAAAPAAAADQPMRTYYMISSHQAHPYFADSHLALRYAADYLMSISLQLVLKDGTQKPRLTLSKLLLPRIPMASSPACGMTPPQKQ